MYDQSGVTRRLRNPLSEGRRVLWLATITISSTSTLQTIRHCQQEAIHSEAYLQRFTSSEHDLVYNLPFSQVTCTTTAAATTSASTSQHQRTHSAGTAVINARLNLMAEGDTPFANRVVIALVSTVLLRERCCQSRPFCKPTVFFHETLSFCPSKRISTSSRSACTNVQHVLQAQTRC